jgi:two-component system OmpR family response regulator
MAEPPPAAGAIAGGGRARRNREPRLQRSLVKALSERGYAVDAAGDGEMALFKAESSEYDAIVLDILMPALDGWEVLERLRRRKRTPVLLLTARDTTPDRVRGLDLGADDYLVKPFDLSELLARLRALIRRTAGITRDVIHVDDVTLDMRARTVSWAGTRIALTAREYSILEYLALHRGKVVSRTELYEHLCGEGDDTLSNVMDVHVSGMQKAPSHADYHQARAWLLYRIGTPPPAAAYCVSGASGRARFDGGSSCG